MQYEVTAPARGFNGEVAGVVFSRGQATADSERDVQALGYFRRKGYTIVAVNAPEPAPDTGPAEQTPKPEPEPSGKPPARSAPKAEWETYARSVAADSDEADDIGNMTKEQLIDHYGQRDQA